MSLDVTVMQSEPKKRHLLLLVRNTADKPQLDRFLCGHDEREWFVAAVPGGASQVRQAMDALQPPEVSAKRWREPVSSAQTLCAQEPRISPPGRMVLRAGTIVGGGRETRSPQ